MRKISEGVRTGILEMRNCNSYPTISLIIYTTDGPVGCIQIFYTGFRVIPADKIFSALKITHNLSARIFKLVRVREPIGAQVEWESWTDGGYMVRNQKVLIVRAV